MQLERSHTGLVGASPDSLPQYGSTTWASLKVLPESSEVQTVGPKVLTMTWPRWLIQIPGSPASVVAVWPGSGPVAQPKLWSKAAGMCGGGARGLSVTSML